MALATFRIAIDNSPVDAEKGVISGCILAQSGKLATFSGSDGKAIEVMVTPSLIDSLLNLANTQARLDAYWTHDRLNPENADKDPIHDSVGVWQNFRKNENGDLIADAALEPSQYREKILWKAQNDKRGIMTSLVFNYRGGRDDAIATEILSGDFVRFGAATTALLSQHKPNNNMTQKEIEEIIEAKFSALQKDAEAKLAEVEIEVDEEDKKGEPEEMPAVMRSFRRLANASKRQTATLSAKLTTLETENATLKAELANAGDTALAKFTAKLGKGDFQIQPPAKTADNDPETAILSAMKTLPEGKNTRAHAKAHIARTNPELYAKL